MDIPVDWDVQLPLHFVACPKDASLFSACFRISRVEESAFRALREKLFAHTSALISAFKVYDKDNTGKSEP